MRVVKVAVIGFYRKKGGSSKSTLCHLALVEFSRNGWNVIDADMDRWLTKFK